VHWGGGESSLWRCGGLKRGRGGVPRGGGGKQVNKLGTRRRGPCLRRGGGSWEGEEVEAH